jgi:hypothetical protein
VNKYSNACRLAWWRQFLYSKFHVIDNYFIWFLIDSIWFGQLTTYFLRILITV